MNSGNLFQIAFLKHVVTSTNSKKNSFMLTIKQI